MCMCVCVYVYVCMIITVICLLPSSAGIGRTGCFIATSIGIQQLQHEHMVDILGIVCSMRLDR